MRTTELKLYSFDELTQEAKEKAINEMREGSYLINDWWDYVYDDFKIKAKEAGFDVKNIYFSGFWSQGDGAMFEYSFEGDILKDIFIEQLILSPMRKQWLSNNTYASANGKQSGHYYHEKSCSHNINWEVDNGDVHWSTNFYAWIESFYDDFDSFVTDIYEGLCIELYNNLEKEYEHLMSDENISDFLIANEYEFLEDGTIY